MGGNVSLVAKDNSYGIAFYESYRNRNPYDRDGDGFSELGKLNMNTFGFRAITVLRISAASIWNTILLMSSVVVVINLICNRMSRILQSKLSTLLIVVVPATIYSGVNISIRFLFMVLFSIRIETVIMERNRT